MHMPLDDIVFSYSSDVWNNPVGFTQSENYLFSKVLSDTFATIKF